MHGFPAHDGFSCPSPRGPGRWFAVSAFLLLAWSGLALAETQPTYAGRTLLEVLRELQASGLELIYSTAVVRPDLRIGVEPVAREPRALLSEVLGPLGLTAREGPSGSIMIVVQPSGGRLRGRVNARLRGGPIPGASVRIEDGGPEVATQQDGTFAIESIVPGRYTVVVQAPGFWSVTLPGVRIADRTATELAVQLEGQPTFVAEVVVTPRLSIERQEQAARRSVDNEDTVLVPTIGGDISRVVELLPGVASGDNTAAFHVRGSTQNDVAVILDGLELYDPYHLKSFQSPFSLVDGKVVDRIDFLGGGFTADLGDRHGGFVEISTVLPDASPRGDVELGSLNSRVSYASQADDGSRSWLLSLRGWYPEVLRDTIELGGGERIDPRFGDAYGKVSFVVSPRTLVSVHALLSYDRLDFHEPADPDGPGERAEALTRNAYLWARFRRTTERLSADTLVSGGQIHRNRNGFSRPQDADFVVEDERVVDFLGLKHDATIQVSGTHLLKAGLDIRRLESDYSYTSVPEADPAAARSLDFTEDGVSLAMYVSHRVRVAPRLATEVGLRWDRQTYTGDNQLTPRFNAVWRAGPRTELRVGLGRYSQSQRIHELPVEDGETAYHGAEISEQADLTAQHRFRSGGHIRLDAYYREQSQLRPRYENLFQPLELFPETGSDRVRIAPESARLRGAEVLLRGNPNRDLTWWVNYALSSAEDDVEGRRVARSWDQTHSLKGLIGRRFGDRWSLSLSGMLHTGWPTTPVTGRQVTLPDNSTEFERVLGPRNSDRFTTYSRLDAKAVRAFDVRRGRLKLSLDVANLTDRKNACCVDEFLFEARPDGGVDTARVVDHWLGITPSFSVLWEF